MSLIATLALAASTATLPACSWDRPGVNPFMGDLVAAVDRYQDIPVATRKALKARMAARRYDEIAVISRDAITGKGGYAAEISDMHFGRGQVCRKVTRARWSDQHRERGLVYCEDGHCLIVPTVCRNLSRITRRPQPIAGAAQEEPEVLAAKQVEPLEFDPPAAGGEIDSFERKLQASPPPPNPEPPAPEPGPGPNPPPPIVPPLPPVNPPPLNPPPLDPPPLTPVPEPASWALFALGLAGLGLRRRVSTLSRA